MERNKERISNMLLEFVLQYIVVTGIASIMMVQGAGFRIIIMGFAMLGYSLLTRLFRIRIEEFLSNIMAHTLGVFGYGMIVMLLINTGIIPVKKWLNGGNLTGFLVVSLAIITIYSLRIVYVRTELDSKEKIPDICVFLPAIGAIVAELAKLYLWQHICLIGFLLSVILVIVRNYATKTAELREVYGSDTNYPGVQIKIVLNALTTALGTVAVVITLCLYRGPAGNYVYNAVKKLLYVILSLLVRKGDELQETTTYEVVSETQLIQEFETESTTQAMPELPTETPSIPETIIDYVTREETIAPPQYDDFSEETLIKIVVAFAFVGIAVIVFIIVNVMSDYIKKKRSKYTIGNDDFENWFEEDDEATDRRPKQKEHGVRRFISYNIDRIFDGKGDSRKVRRLYRDSVLNSQAEEIKGLPKDITNNCITKDEKQGKIITDIYEKARYSENGITKEELSDFEETLDKNK